MAKFKPRSRAPQKFGRRSPKSMGRQGSPKHRAFFPELPGDILSLPQLRWMDRLLRSFSEETPEEWLPSQYQSLYQHDWSKKPTLH